MKRCCNVGNLSIFRKYFYRKQITSEAPVWKAALVVKDKLSGYFFRRKGFRSNTSQKCHFRNIFPKLLPKQYLSQMSF